MKSSKASSSEPDMLKLIHELEVHQIELEMQNEELKRAKEKAEIAEKKYTELYNFAPSGFLTLTKEGEITELNNSAEHLLGKERSHLIKSSFGFFVSIDTRAVYNSFLQKVFKKKLK
jgi:PAS domain-containing protein